ncbi:HEPN-associated N-terminal domain-containing protein [Bacillus inaquosorum]|uniref:HEPN-associated N-terminal domain-containing protein n=1 Tax=Bacillus inaquosorum TaxID=483913 RepID=UPI002E1CEF00|nr:HEPN-associated N-terminal domain-containing protein [Bacillus inaquosorum]
MGYHKELLIRQNELGFSSLGDKFVCSKCVSDPHIQDYIDENVSSIKCNYCGAVEDDYIAADVDTIIEFILKGVRYEWGDPDDEGVSYDSREGGYQGADIYDGWNFAQEILFDEVGINNNNLFEDIRSAISDTTWCRVDPYGSTLVEEFFYNWHDFSDQVKYSIRYLFLNYPSRTTEGKTAPHVILDNIADFVEELGLIKEVPPMKFYRVRVSSKGEKFTKARELGTPAKEYAMTSNRMSPAGIPMFYGAQDKETALCEVKFESGENVIASIGEFKNNSNLILLDLTSLPALPSIFDEKEREKRWMVRFLQQFLIDFTKPIDKDGREHVDYVPTQIVTEYFRYVYETSNKSPVAGIAYPSSINNEKAYVLFFENQNCKDFESDTGLTLKKVTYHT